MSVRDFNFPRKLIPMHLDFSRIILSRAGVKPARDKIILEKRVLKKMRFSNRSNQCHCLQPTSRIATACLPIEPSAASSLSHKHSGQPARRPLHEPWYCRRVVVACMIHMKIKKGICGDHLIIYHSVIDKQFMSARSQHVAPMFISPIEKTNFYGRSLLASLTYSFSP